jgi:hypothetical protein
MKIVIAFSLSLCLVFVLLNCEKDVTDSKIYLAETILGGCNLYEEADLKSTIQDERDTVIFSLASDTLSIFTGINFICCAPFVTNCEIENDSIKILISDSCEEPDYCYCRCDCYYTFDFRLTEFGLSIYNYKIQVISQILEMDYIIDQGTIDLSEL